MAEAGEIVVKVRLDDTEFKAHLARMQAAFDAAIQRLEPPRDATPAEAESEDSNELDDVYHDRNLLAQLAAVMARKLGYAGGWRDGDDPAWPILTIDLPTGQVSWHVPKDDQLPICRYGQPWDGHTTGEKWLRVERYILSHNEMQPAEPSIPVSRIVAVLAEAVRRNRGEAGRPCPEFPAAREYECRLIALDLDIWDAVDAELARRKGAA